jgi:hypothetical protein
VGQLREACSKFFNQIGAGHGVNLLGGDFCCLGHGPEKSLPPQQGQAFQTASVIQSQGSVVVELGTQQSAQAGRASVFGLGLL